MKKRQYFLVVENQTKTDFMHLKDNVGIKVFLPSYIPTNDLKRISTEPEPISGETPELCANMLKNKYQDYDVFYLNIGNIGDWADYKQVVNFDLDLQPNITVAFVCIPKNESRYKHDQVMYRIFVVGFGLEKYYNDYKIWTVYVVDENFSEDYVDKHHFFRSTTRYEPAEKAFFERCKTKYGIPQIELSLTKYIMRTNKESIRKKSVYMLTPKFMNKVRRHKKRQNQKCKMEAYHDW